MNTLYYTNIVHTHTQKNPRQKFCMTLFYSNESRKIKLGKKYVF